MKCLLVVLFLVALLMPDVVVGRGMWGSRRKQRDDEDRDSTIAAGLGSGFETRNTLASMSRKFAGVEVDGSVGEDVVAPPRPRRAASSAATTTAGMGGAGNGLADTVASLLQMYLKMMEDLVHSPDFDTLVTPETMKTMFAKLPGGLADSPEIAGLLDSPQFSDPTLLKQTVLQGVEAIKLYSHELVDMFNHPEKLVAMLDQLPPEMKGAVEGMLQGDMSGLKGMLAAIPGIDESQRALLTNMLDGNVQGMAQQAKALLGQVDVASQTEAARQQFLANPAMAEALGMSADVLHDQENFEALMAQGLDLLNQAFDGAAAGEAQGSSDGGGGSVDDDEAGAASNRLFKGARMAA